MQPNEDTWPVARVSDCPKLRSRKVRIDVVRGPDKGRCAELPGPETRIGSAADCDLVLSDPTISRMHMILRVEREAVRVIDAGSRNGVIIDGLQVRDALARTDSAITIGETTLRLRMLSEVVEIPLSPNERFGKMLGKSVAMRRIFAQLERVALTDATVLIEGETGTGKELAAEAVHEASARANRPFVVVDCSALSANLMESELFGHVRGAFTGAHADRIGALEEADGGTLFLDEIGELPLDLQPKLLRALESRDVRRVGTNKPRHVDVRIIAATNRSLLREVEAGAFREDLYFRLAVVAVRLPPLRERPEDISLLVRHFEKEHACAGTTPLPESMIASWMRQSWPGNVRHLRNTLIRTIALREHEAFSEGTGEPLPVLGDISLDVPLLQGRERLLAAYEKAYIERALAVTGGNVCKAAELAGVGRRFIQKAMNRYGLRGNTGK